MAQTIRLFQRDQVMIARAQRVRLDRTLQIVAGLHRFVHVPDGQATARQILVGTNRELARDFPPKSIPGFPSSRTQPQHRLRQRIVVCLRNRLISGVVRHIRRSHESHPDAAPRVGRAGEAPQPAGRSTCQEPSNSNLPFPAKSSQCRIDQSNPRIHVPSHAPTLQSSYPPAGHSASPANTRAR